MKVGVFSKCIHRRIDSNLEYGQVRSLSEDTVTERVQQLLENPPSVVLRLTVHHDTGVFPCFPWVEARARLIFLGNLQNPLFLTVSGVYFVLSGQHLFAACSRILLEKQKANLPIPKCVFSP